MEIKSPAFKNNESIPSEYTCQGGNINPPLEIVDTPTEAISLALVCEDPDAPLGTWTHWLIWNIDARTKIIDKNSKPQGSVEGITSGGQAGYEGPCPPSGTHRYYFKIFALDNVLELDQNADIKKLNETMNNHILDKAELIGLYQKQ